MDDRHPSVVIRELQEARQNWSDDAILAELAALPVLPPKSLSLERDWYGPHNPAWDDPLVTHQLMVYLALRDIIGNRKLRAGVPLLLERASYGDMGETMRGLRHSLEAAYNPDWSSLADVCMQAAKSPQPGARLWAVNELGVLRDVRALPVLIETLYDRAKLVRLEACSALKRLSASHPEIRQQVGDALKHLIVETTETLKHAQDSLKAVEIDPP